MTPCQVTARRGGLITVGVLVCLLVTSTLAVLTMQSALRARRELLLHQQMLQTDWLLDAGVQRAVQRLSESSAYSGETWRPIEAISRYPAAQVIVRVTPCDEGGVCHVEVVASLGRGDDDLPAASITQRTHTFEFPTSTAPTEE